MSPYYRFGPLHYKNYHNIGGNASNITGCPDGVQWLWTVLGDCAVTTREQVSAYCGLASILIWMLVNFPQMIKNCRNLDGLAGVSFFLLFQWAGGDITNLIGSLLTHQLKPQIILACYFVVTDVVLLIQYSGYLIRKNRRKKAEDNARRTQTPQVILCLMGLFAFSHAIWSQGFTSSSSSIEEIAGKYQMSPGHLSRSLLSVSAAENGPVLLWSEKNESSHIRKMGKNRMLGSSIGSIGSAKTGEDIFWHDEVNIIGYVIGILSSVFYLGSRLAQIYKNIKTQSTDGLALLTFVLAVFGNVFYGAQILVEDLSAEFLLEKTPWLVGSLGVVGLDCFLLFQFRYYKSKHRDRDEMNRALLTKEFAINADEVPDGYDNAGESNGYIY